MKKVQRRGLTWEQFCSHGATLPGMEQGTCFGTPALYVRKKFLARLKEDGESVAIKVDFFDRDALLEAFPRAFYLTDHYRPYPMVLMRLGQVRPAVAVGLLEQAWRKAAPKRLVLELSSRVARRTASPASKGREGAMASPSSRRTAQLRREKS